MFVTPCIYTCRSTTNLFEENRFCLMTSVLHDVSMASVSNLDISVSVYLPLILSLSFSLFPSFSFSLFLLFSLPFSDKIFPCLFFLPFSSSSSLLISPSLYLPPRSCSSIYIFSPISKYYIKYHLLCKAF